MAELSTADLVRTLRAQALEADAEAEDLRARAESLLDRARELEELELHLWKAAERLEGKA
ncbi:hypothetical protein [Modestobacter sp. KNN46-3]|uniref:hypothetical protein n=1 Tax=Modestobacter sp. KNN46-3 TaxID=2711218 RepID=UPI0013E02180|nr:hypothetical protein [Modestobacter sp. KNN46-3]